MKIAIEGCAHGDLDKIYETIQHLESQDGIKVDLLICCGDFQATRNEEDLRCMAVPPKYRHMCSFYKYYSGESKAPVLTLFIGGNHEASNHLQELAYGGWAAPNIYYMGYAGVVTYGGVRIAGLSGIYKGFDYMRGHHEKPPYTDKTVRSVYHVRNLEVFRLKQLTRPVQIALSHDWPRGVTDHGDTEKLLKRKGFFAEDIKNNRLGSEPAAELLSALRPDYWFAAHLHCKYPAIVRHGPRQGVTRFLALDKCLPRRKFLQIVDLEPTDPSEPLELRYDLEWLAVLRATNHLLSVKPNITYMPGKSDHERWIFTPTEEEKQDVLKRFEGNLKIPLNFSKTVAVHDSGTPFKGRPRARVNPLTTELCSRLGIDDPMALAMASNSESQDSLSFDVSLSLTPDGQSDYSRLSDSFSTRLDSSADSTSSTPFKRLSSMRLPPPKLVEDSDDFLSLSYTSQDSLQVTQEMPQSEQETSQATQDRTSTTQETLLSAQESSEMSQGASLSTQEKSQTSESEPFVSPSKKKSIDETEGCSERESTSSIGSAPKKFKRRNQSLYTSTEDED